jgi:hypothetical protein
MKKDEKKMGIRSKYRQKYGAVPYALDLDGNPVGPREAQAGRFYRCPCCRKEVSLRQPKKRRHHFAHLYKGRCKLDSPVMLAKHVLYFTIYQWLRGKGDPVEVMTFCEQRYEMLRLEIESLRMDHKIKRNNKRRLHTHLSILDRYKIPLLNIKIHADSPTRFIKHPGWLDVSAEEVLANPYLLSPLNPYMAIPPFLNPVQQQLSLF